MNVINPSAETPFWECFISADTVPNTVIDVKKVSYPNIIIDNSTSLMANYHNITSFITDSKLSVINFINVNNIDLNGKTIPE